MPASLGPGLRTAGGAKRRRGGTLPLWTGACRRIGRWLRFENPEVAVQRAKIAPAPEAAIFAMFVQSLRGNIREIDNRHARAAEVARSWLGGAPHPDPLPKERELYHARAAARSLTRGTGRAIGDAKHCPLSLGNFYPDRCRRDPFFACRGRERTRSFGELS